MEMKFEVSGKIGKPVDQVFEAVVDPDRLSSYFTTTGAKGRMVTGATVEWSFPEHPEPFPVEVVEVVDNERVVLEWEAAPTPGLPEHLRTRVTMLFEPLADARTLVRIQETGWPSNQAGLQSSYDNNGGWMHMLCCLKARLEYDIALREGMWT